jgi:hypothetical protein
MNHYGTLSALQPLLGIAGIIMHRCRRRLSDEPLYYLESGQRDSTLPGLLPKTSRRGYTLSEILNWLYLTGENPVSQRAHTLLTQLDDGAPTPNRLN